MRKYLNNGWIFNRDGGKEEIVRLPHANENLPFNYTDESAYQFISTYRLTLAVGEEEYAKGAAILTFLGVAHGARVSVNGNLAMENACGYTAFSADVRKYLKIGENEIEVVCDSRETLDVPPFGNVIDYLTYGGIYREAYIDYESATRIKDIFAVGYAESEPYNFVLNAAFSGGDKVKYTIYQQNKALFSAECEIADGKIESYALVPNAKLWSIAKPNLASVTLELYCNGEKTDEKSVRFGFRTCRFFEDGFYLNGEKIKLRGLNRHQSYAYVGYAMPSRVQRRDAEIIKNELCCNAVRTSHYPQSQDFLDACDELGLLVFTEIPGWQHIGGASWRAQALINVRNMVTQYRNHPSIILWGVRINESKDCDELYEATNALAHELDFSRQTGGVRYLTNSKLLEDVYTFNDFSHTGDNRGTQNKRGVTKTRAPYLVTEFNGHMYPTKSYDDEPHRLEHALRHARVIDSIAGDDNVSGGFGWCAFDYNTHKEFGAADRICYHGVCDMFRNPKTAAAVYASQGEKNYFHVSTALSRGDYAGGMMREAVVFTNADCVNLYMADRLVSTTYPDYDSYPNLAHPPIVVSDFIGNALVENEGMSQKSQKEIKKALAACPNFSKIPLKYLLVMLKVKLRERLTIAELIDKVAKYVATWGNATASIKLEAVRNGKAFASYTADGTECGSLIAEADTTELVEGDTYDVASIRIKSVGKTSGNLMSYDFSPVTLEASGSVELIGDKLISLQGGMFGTYVRSVKKGKGTLTLKRKDEVVTLEFNVK